MRSRKSKRADRVPRSRRVDSPAARPPRPLLATPAGSARVFVPQGYEPGYDYPLIVWLADPAVPFDLGRAMARTSLRNFVAVQPAAAADPEMRAWRAIDRVRERFSIHPRRIYLVGQGSGGSAAFRIGCRQPEAFGGIVSLGGPFPLDEGLFAAAERVRRLPMLLCLGELAVAADPARVDRTLRLYHAAGASLSLRIYPAAGTPGVSPSDGRRRVRRPTRSPVCPGNDDLSHAVLADVNRWLMDDVCKAAADEPARCAP